MSNAASISRRILCALMLGASVLPVEAFALPNPKEKGRPVKITCFICYHIDPFQREAFQAYARNWLTIIPRAGGDLIGYFLPYEGTNNIGWALISFPSLAEYEQYRARLRADADAKRNFAFAQEKRFILHEERTFLEMVTN